MEWKVARFALLIGAIMLAFYLGITPWEKDTIVAQSQQPPKDSKEVKIVIKTNKGDISLALFPEFAPITVANFAKLLKSDFYKGLTFHRYVPNFVIQGGDPNGDGTGGPGWTIKDEHDNGLTHIEGAIAMARTQRPNSAGSQFYITLAPTHQLDGQYTVFGKVKEGMDVVKQLRAGDVMNEIKIIDEEKAAK